MDNKMTKEVEKVVEKVYYVRKIEKLDSKGKKLQEKAGILNILACGLCLAGLISKEFSLSILMGGTSIVSGTASLCYYLLDIINDKKCSNIKEKLEELEEKEKIYEELKGLEETKEMEGKTK